MTYKKHQKELKKIYSGLILYLEQCKDLDDVAKIEQELARLKHEIKRLEDLTESQLHEQRKTITCIIDSWMNV